MKFYSEKLNKMFDTQRELFEAEVKADEREKKMREQAEKEKQEREAKEAERTKELDEVESAYKHYLELKNAYVNKYRSNSVSNVTNDLLGGLIDLLFKD